VSRKEVTKEGEAVEGVASSFLRRVNCHRVQFERMQGLRVAAGREGGREGGGEAQRVAEEDFEEGGNGSVVGIREERVEGRRGGGGGGGGRRRRRGRGRRGGSGMVVCLEDHHPAPVFQLHPNRGRGRRSILSTLVLIRNKHHPLLLLRGWAVENDAEGRHGLSHSFPHEREGGREKILIPVSFHANERRGRNTMPVTLRGAGWEERPEGEELEGGKEGGQGR